MGVVQCGEPLENKIILKFNLDDKWHCLSFNVYSVSFQPQNVW